MQLALWSRFPLRRLAEVAQPVRPFLSPRAYAITPDPASLGAQKRPEPARRLEVEVLQTGEEVLVRLRGEAGAPEAEALEGSLWHLVARRPAGVTLDLSELRFISNLAMGVLAAYCRAAVRAGARIYLKSDLRPAVREALTRSDLMGLFEAVDGAPLFAEGTRNHIPNVYDLQRTFGVTWGQLVELEPHLETLLGRARPVGGNCRTLTDVERVFGPLRDELAGLIGFAGKHHQHPVLGNAGAYEVAYWVLYDAVAGLLPGGAAGT